MHSFLCVSVPVCQFVLISALYISVRLVDCVSISPAACELLDVEQIWGMCISLRCLFTTCCSASSGHLVSLALYSGCGNSHQFIFILD